MRIGIYLAKVKKKETSLSADKKLSYNLLIEMQIVMSLLIIL